MSSDPFVIVGAGHAARKAAQTLREYDSECEIILYGAEPELPYDRPALSKQALTQVDGERLAFIRDQAWYDAQRITLRLGATVTRIDRDNRTIATQDGSSIRYRRLLIATGSRVRPLDRTLHDGVPLHYVRTVADARRLKNVLQPKKRIAIVGGGFIGLEVAASATQMGCHVTVLEGASRLLQRALPPVVSAFALTLHQEHGVDVRLRTAVQGIRQRSDCLEIQTPHDGVPADAVVVGIGVMPNGELAHEAGLHVDNGIVVDHHCRTNDPFIFAAGEVTNHFNSLLGRHLRLESWQVAENQSVVAARNMLGAAEIYAEVPWLWSDQFDCNIQSLGFFSDEQHVVVRRSPNSRAFTVLGLTRDGVLQAVATVDNGRDIAVGRRLMAAGKALDLERLNDATIPFRAFL